MCWTSIIETSLDFDIISLLEIMPHFLDFFYADFFNQQFHFNNKISAFLKISSADSFVSEKSSFDVM